MKPTWKNTLNSDHKLHGHIYDFVTKAVIPSGYQYFTWNGIVYKTNSENFEATKYYESDLE